MTHNLARRVTAVLAGPLVAAGVFAGSMALAAPAEAGTSSTTGTTECSSMAMPNTQADPAASPLTRASQVTSANPTPHAPVFNTPC
ncbi:MAG TPA: hypothetical protein VIJ23_19270 [Mycobacterium sp.]